MRIQEAKIIDAQIHNLASGLAERAKRQNNISSNLRAAGFYELLLTREMNEALRVEIRSSRDSALQSAFSNSIFYERQGRWRYILPIIYETVAEREPRGGKRADFYNLGSLAAEECAKRLEEMKPRFLGSVIDRLSDMYRKYAQELAAKAQKTKI